MPAVSSGLARNDVAGPGAGIIEDEPPQVAFLLRTADDQRSTLPELQRPRQDVFFRGAGNDDLEPEFLHGALRHPGMLEAGDPLVPDLDRLLDAARAFLCHFLDNVPERQLVVAGQDDLLARLENVDLV